MNETAECLQRTVSLTWNKPEWLLPEPQNEFQKDFDYISILIATQGGVIPGRYHHKQMRFFDYDAGSINTEFVEFWAYIPKHPTRCQ